MHDNLIDVKILSCFTLVGKYFTHSLRNICASTGAGLEEEPILAGPGKMSAFSHNGMLKSCSREGNIIQKLLYRVQHK